MFKKLLEACEGDDGPTEYNTLDQVSVKDRYREKKERIEALDTCATYIAGGTAESTEELLLVPMVDEVRQQCRQLANQRAWLPMARHVTGREELGESTSRVRVEHPLPT